MCKIDYNNLIFDYANQMFIPADANYPIDSNINKERLKHCYRNNEISRNFNIGIPNIFIQSTYRCNARCKYCFEQSYMSDLYMSDEVALKTAKYIQQFAVNNSAYLTFFGGEPTVYTKPFDIITEYLDRNFIEYYSTMTTNGYLLDTFDIYKMIFKYHMVDIQISLDGDDPEYSIAKNYKNNDSHAVDKILGNIENLFIKTTIHVLLRLNINLTNSDSIYRFIDKLKLFNNKYHNKLSVYCTAINSAKGFTLTDEESKYLAEQEFELNKYLLYQNFNLHTTTNITPSAFACTANNPFECMITPNGNVVICSESHDCSDVLSNVDSFGIENKEVRLKFATMAEYNLCKDCPRYIICSITNLCPSSNGCNSQFKERMLNRDKLFVLKNSLEFYNEH